VSRSKDSILEALNLDRRSEGFLKEAPEPDEDMLEITFHQLPKGWNQRDFDWSGRTNYTRMHRKVWHKASCNPFSMNQHRTSCRRGLVSPGF
jgi:hypothetical protein